MLKNFGRFLLQQIILPACGYFTLFIFLISLAQSFESDIQTPCIVLSQAMVILLFSFVFSALNRILYLRSLHVFARIGIHFLSCVASLILILMLLSGYYSSNGSGPMIFLTVVFVVCYLIVLAFYFFIQFFRRKNRKE